MSDFMDLFHGSANQKSIPLKMKHQTESNKGIS